MPSERKDLWQEKFQTLEKVHRHVIERLPDMVISLDASGNVLTANNKVAIQLGYSAEDLQRMNIQAIIVPESVPGFWEVLNTAGDYDQDLQEIDLITRNGESLPVALYPISLVDRESGKHGEESFLLILYDLREQKKLKELEAQVELKSRQLIQKQRILEIIYNGIEKGIIFIDHNFRIIKANRYLAQLFGKRPEDLIGQKCYHIFGDGTSRKCKNCPADNTLQADLPVAFNRRITNQKGKTIYLQNTTFPLLDKANGISGFIHFTEDITQSVQLQNQLVQSEKFIALGKFSSCITHDLRNPLTVIRNAAYYLQRKVNPEEEKIMHYLDIIQKETDQAERIVSDLLTFCRPQPLQIEKISIPDLLENLLATLSVPPHITLKREYHHLLSPVHADQNQIKRVFHNIIKNAFEAMPSEGQLTINAVEEADTVIISFEDTGTGITEKDRASLFEPFFTTKAKGTGLGLYICKSIIEQHRGALWVENSEGPGACFLMALPKKYGAEDEPLQSHWYRRNENKKDKAGVSTHPTRT
ncbi:MAG: ATP-binding protein [bacterium]